MGKEEKEIQKLVTSAQEGDADSVGQLFDHFQPRIFRYLLFRISISEEAEDLTQIVFLEMVRSLPRYNYRMEAKFSTWLFQIARFRLIDHYRARKETVSLDDNHNHPSLSVLPNEVHFDTRTEHVWRALSELSETHQTVLHLAYTEDMSAAEIAKVIETSAINIRVIKSRAISKLRQILARYSNDSI